MSGDPSLTEHIDIDHPPAPARTVSPFAGKPADPSLLVDIPRLVAAYYSERPDPSRPEQRVSFGTSGHRGSAFTCGFNEFHILAIAQAVCRYRHGQGIDGPLFIGIDTHALSEPACRSALEVLAANERRRADRRERRVHANAGRLPCDPRLQPRPHQRPRGRHRHHAVAQSARGWRLQVQPAARRAGGNGCDRLHRSAGQRVVERGLAAVRRVAYEKALRASTTHRHDFLNTYVADLGNVVDLEAVRGSGLKLGVDPLGGAGVHYWAAIAERYGLNLTITNPLVDATFRFMDVDWDGRIRMDPSSPYAMQSLIGLKDTFDVAFACDTDHDRHGVVAKSVGLLPAEPLSRREHSLSVFDTGPNGAGRQPSARPPCRAA
jgi:phosphoglucomutase